MKTTTAHPLPIMPIILALLLAVTIPYALLVYTEHSKTSHSSHVPSIENCFRGGGKLSGWYVGPDGRYAQHCYDGGRHRYWRIAECQGKEMVIITQFKQGVNKLFRYIRNKEFVEMADRPPCR